MLDLNNLSSTRVSNRIIPPSEHLHAVRRGHLLEQGRDRVPVTTWRRLFQWIVSGIVQGNFPFQLYLPKDCHLPGGFSRICPMDFKWHLPTTLHFCDFRCEIIICPERLVSDSLYISISISLSLSHSLSLSIYIYKYGSCILIYIYICIYIYIYIYFIIFL